MASCLFTMKDHDPTPILYSEVTIFMLESSKTFGVSIEIIFWRLYE